MNQNPYQAPKADLVSNNLKISRKGKKELFIPLECDLPNRCVKCNAILDRPAKVRQLYWHSPFIYLVLIINILLYAILAYFFRKKVKLSLGLCEIHSSKRYNIIAGLILLIIVSLVLFIMMKDTFSLFFLTITFISIIALIIKFHIVSVTKIDDNGVSIKGCGKEFLESFD